MELFGFADLQGTDKSLASSMQSSELHGWYLVVYAGPYHQHNSSWGNCMSLLNNRITAVVAGSVLVVGLGATGAVAGDLIDSGDIRDGSVRSVDLHGGVSDRIQNKATDREITGIQERISVLEAQVAALEAQDASGVNTNWVANAGSTVVDTSTIELTGPTPTSVEILNLDLPVDATKTVEFTYSLADGATYGGGAPRVFIEVGGDFINTNDADPNNPGTDNGDGTFTKSVVIGKNGRVGAAGVVYDSGNPGTVTVTDLVISGHAISFE
jgi:hypothetical protein